MSNDYIVTSKTLPDGQTVTVKFDVDPESPRDWDNVATVALADRSRYDFGDERLSADEIRAIVNDPDFITLPVYMYDHSGVTINTTGFSCGWDSGQAGIVYMSKADAVANWGKKLCTRKVKELARACMKSEIECLDQYITGTVYGYEITDKDGEVTDSCWGFYGESDECLAEGIAASSYTAQMSLPFAASANTAATA